MVADRAVMAEYTAGVNALPDVSSGEHAAGEECLPQRKMDNRLESPQQSDVWNVICAIDCQYE